MVVPLLETSCSYGNVLRNNTFISNKFCGIHLYWLSSTEFYNNSMTNCGLFLEVYSYYYYEEEYEESMDIWAFGTDNTVNNKPFYYWYYITNRSIPAGAGQIILYGCKNI